MQKGSAQLIASPLGVEGGGGVLRGEPWVERGGGEGGMAGFVGSNSSGTREVTLLPEIWRSEVSQGTIAGRTWSVCEFVCVYLNLCLNRYCLSKIYG